MPTIKPGPPADYQSGHALGTNPAFICGLMDNTVNPPLDDVDDVAAAWTTDNGGTTTPAFGVDSGGVVGLEFIGVTDKELRFAGKGAVSADAAGGVTLYCVYEPDSGAGNCGIVGASPTEFVIVRFSDGRFFVYLGGYRIITGVTLTADHRWALVATIAQMGLITGYARDLTDEVTSTPATNDLNTDIGSALGSAADAVINPRSLGCCDGVLSMAGVALEVWDATKANAFLADPWAALVATFRPMIGSPLIGSGGFRSPFIRGVA